MPKIPIQISIEAIQGTSRLITLTINAEDYLMFSKVLRTMADVCEHAKSNKELTAADLRTLLKLIDA